MCVCQCDRRGRLRAHLARARRRGGSLKTPDTFCLHRLLQRRAGRSQRVVHAEMLQGGNPHLWASVREINSTGTIYTLQCGFMDGWLMDEWNYTPSWSWLSRCGPHCSSERRARCSSPSGGRNRPDLHALVKQWVRGEKDGAPTVQLNCSGSPLGNASGGVHLGRCVPLHAWRVIIICLSFCRARCNLGSLFSPRGNTYRYRAWVHLICQLPAQLYHRGEDVSQDMLFFYFFPQCHRDSHCWFLTRHHFHAINLLRKCVFSVAVANWCPGQLNPQWRRVQRVLAWTSACGWSQH